MAKPNNRRISYPSKKCEYHESMKNKCQFYYHGSFTDVCGRCGIMQTGMVRTGKDRILMCWACVTVEDKELVEYIKCMESICGDCSDINNAPVMVVWNDQPRFVRHQKKIKRANN